MKTGKVGGFAGFLQRRLPYGRPVVFARKQLIHMKTS